MWTRAELKDRAKMCLSRYYWAAFLVSLIFAILSGFGGSNANTQRITSYLEQNESGNSQTDQSSLIPGELGGDGSLSGNTGSGLASGIELVPGLGDAYGPGAGNAGSMVASNLFYRLFAGAVIVIVIISVVIGIFVQPLFEIGRNRFYMESRVTGQSAGIGKLFWGFSNGYLKLVGTQFLRGLITESVVILASLLGFLVILFNGVEWIGSVFWAVMICATIGAFVSVYFQYCYLMVPYILAENPDMKTMEVLRLSKEMFRRVLFRSGWTEMERLCTRPFLPGMAAFRNPALRYRNLLRSAICGCNLCGALRSASRTIFGTPEWIRRGTVCTE